MFRNKSIKEIQKRLAQIEIDKIYQQKIKEVDVINLKLKNLGLDLYVMYLIEWGSSERYIYVIKTDEDGMIFRTTSNLELESYLQGYTKATKKLTEEKRNKPL